jgi:hypothetical protein
MDYNDFLNAVIDDGQSEVRIRFLQPNQSLRLSGALEGFEACRGLKRSEITQTLDDARLRTRIAMDARASDYWFWRERELQIGWVLSVIGSVNFGETSPADVSTTLRPYLKALDVFGIQNPIEGRTL